MPDWKRSAQASAFDAIRDWVTCHLGIRYSSDQAAVLGRRLGMVFGPGAEQSREIADRLRRGDPSVVEGVTAAATTNHTSFFRESETIDHFIHHALPRLPMAEPLRVWSAAASSGEEAYSIAMASKQHLGPLSSSRLHILGTDINARQVELAERGVYDADSLRSVPSEYLRYFVRQPDGSSRVAPETAAMCTFRRLNLASFPWPFQKKFHAVFLRNILYYFDAALRRRVLEHAFDATLPGGWLFVGLGESMWGTSSRWTPVDHGIFRKGAGP